MYIIILVKQVYWYISQVSGERLQDHWFSGLSQVTSEQKVYPSSTSYIQKEHMLFESVDILFILNHTHSSDNILHYFILAATWEDQQPEYAKTKTQRLCFRYMDSAIPLLLMSKISSF